MLRDIRLLDYLPPYVQDYREIREIMNTENPEFQLVADESERILNNQFILTSDEVGIVRFERLLKIFPSPDDTLKSRISRVMARWNDVVPYTYKALIEKLIFLSDGMNFTINAEFNEYRMEIITHLELPGQVDELQNLLGYMIPVNLELTSSNEIYCDSEGEGKIAAGFVSFNMFELSDAYNADFNISGESKLAASLSSVNVTELSDAYQEEVTIQGDSKLGGGIVGTASVLITDNFNEEITTTGESTVGSNASITSINGIN
ncbi:putative phage tail protein [Chryseomicrobium palamuruense]|uniref:Phage tail protein n=1 Tax=Chryseomicrobium palamuruense TaxID=682973 RepID=A0ABV8UVE4_9BACL